MLIAKGLGEAVPAWFGLVCRDRVFNFPAFAEGWCLEVLTRCWQLTGKLTHTQLWKLRCEVHTKSPGHEEMQIGC